MRVSSSTKYCSYCRGAGYYLLEVPYGHPDFGQLMTCQCRATEKQQQRRQRLLEMSNLGPLPGEDV